MPAKTKKKKERKSKALPPMNDAQRAVHKALIRRMLPFRKEIVRRWPELMRIAIDRYGFRADMDKMLTTDDKPADIPRTPKLLGESEKVEKGEGAGILTRVLYLAQARTALQKDKGTTVCAYSTPGCEFLCLGKDAGKMDMANVKWAQVWKSALLKADRDLFFTLLSLEIEHHEFIAGVMNKQPAIRLDGTSDLHLARWKFKNRETDEYCKHLCGCHPNVQFYDYTKNYKMAIQVAVEKRGPCGNWSLTFSFTGRDPSRGITDEIAQQNAVSVLAGGGNVAIVFATKKKSEKPLKWPLDCTGRDRCFEVIDGDDTDVRFDDPPGTVVGLTIKGKLNPDYAYTNSYGFVHQPYSSWRPDKKRALIGRSEKKKKKKKKKK